MILMFVLVSVLTCSSDSDVGSGFRIGSKVLYLLSRSFLGLLLALLRAAGFAGGDGQR